MAVIVRELLTRLPRVSLAVLPTPLQRLPRLSERLGIEVWVKRDDLTGLGLGGNKARKLEFLVGDALAKEADVLVTGGGPSSNHVQLTAAAAARLGLGCIAVLYGSPPDPEPANLRLTRLYGAEVRFTRRKERSSVDGEIEVECARLTATGRRPYLIPRGGASPVGCVGYIEAALELQSQLDDRQIIPDRLYVATGSCGTQAGVILGADLARATYKVMGASVSRPPDECESRITNLIAGCEALLGIQDIDRHEQVHLLDYRGLGYGKPSAEGEAAAELGAAQEGLVLDPVFTAKAMAALLTDTRAGTVKGPVVFLHTGGMGSLLGGDM